MKTYIALWGLSFLLSLLLTPIIQGISIRRGWFDQPDEQRVHDKPVPRLGGVAVFLAFTLSLLPLLLVHNPITIQMRMLWSLLSDLLPAVLAIFVLGVLDDIFGLKPYVKLLVQVACGVWVFYHGVRIGIIANPAGKPFDLGIWSLPLTVLWLVGITNAFNLVDGIDGLAGGIALFGMATMVVISIFTDSGLPFALVATLAGAVSGFLPYNFHPASIFLGDSGSLFLGFTLGALSLVWAQKSTLAVSILGPILIFALPIADTGLAIVRRFFSGAPLFTRDRDHIHHRLLRLGLSPQQVVIVLYAACFVVGLLALTFVHVSAGLALFALVFLLLSSWLVLSQLGYPELAEINLTFRRGLLDQRDIIGQRVRLRKAVEALSQSESLDELWARIVETARTFEFDHVEMSLDEELQKKYCGPGEPRGEPPPVRQYWSDGAPVAFAEHPEKFWKIEIPLGGDSGKVSHVTFLRMLGRSELHLRMEPFVWQLVSNISKGLARIQKRAS